MLLQVISIKYISAYKNYWRSLHSVLVAYQQGLCLPLRDSFKRRAGLENWEVRLCYSTCFYSWIKVELQLKHVNIPVQYDTRFFYLCLSHPYLHLHLNSRKLTLWVLLKNYTTVITLEKQWEGKPGGRKGREKEKLYLQNFIMVSNKYAWKGGHFLRNSLGITTLL